MEIKIIDIPSTIPYNGYISAKELGFIEYAPVRFYSNSTLNIVHVKKEGKVLTVNKSYSSIVNSDKRILECSGDMVKCGLEDFVYDVEEKKPIFDCKTSAALYDFYTYPAFSDDLGSVLIVTHDGKLKKFYPKTGIGTALFAVRLFRLFPYIPELQYTKFGYALFAKIIGDVYGVINPQFTAVYDDEIIGLEDKVREKHRLLSGSARELKINLCDEFLKEVNSAVAYGIKKAEKEEGEEQVEFTLSYITHNGIPITDKYVDLELDVKIQGINSVGINDGVLYIDSSLEVEELIKMFGDNFIQITKDEEGDEYVIFNP